MKRRNQNFITSTKHKTSPAGNTNESMVNAFKEAENIAGKIFDIFEKGSQSIVTSFASAFGYVQQMVSLVQSIQNTTSFLSSLLSFIPGGGVISGILEGGGRASGGDVTGTVPYLVGEKGPEIFIPDVNGFILPDDKTSDVIGSMNEDMTRDRDITSAEISSSAVPNITVIVQSEVEASKAVKFFSNHFPDYENRRGKEYLK